MFDVKKSTYSNAVFLDRGSIDTGDIDFSSLQKALANWQFFDATQPNELAERIASADVLISNKVLIDKASIAKAKNLKLICIAATGTNNVDLLAAREAGIKVCNVPGYASASVTQHTFTLILALAGKLAEYQRAVRNGDWSRARSFCLLDYPVIELQGKNIGIMGYGDIGQGVSSLAKSLGMNVLVSARKGQQPGVGRTAFDKVLRESDVLTLHCPLTDETRGMIGAAELALMKPSALLINTARGGLVDEIALLNALQEHRLGGAGLDVLCEEPPSLEHPLLNAKLSHLICTPHMAWGSRESRQRLVEEISKNIQAAKNHQPRNLV